MPFEEKEQQQEALKRKNAPYSPPINKNMAALTNELFFFFLFLKGIISTTFTIDIYFVKMLFCVCGKHFENCYAKKKSNKTGAGSGLGSYARQSPSHFQETGSGLTFIPTYLHY